MMVSTNSLTSSISFVHKHIFVSAITDERIVGDVSCGSNRLPQLIQLEPFDQQLKYLLWALVLGPHAGSVQLKKRCV